MKFDVVVIGGGLSGATAALSLQAAGKKVALVSFGECSLFLGSGCIGLGPVENAPEGHPYSKVQSIDAKVAAIPAFFEKAGIKLYGSAEKDAYRVSQVGNLLPCRWSFAADVLVESPASLKGRKLVICDHDGSINFPSSIVAAKLEALGAEVKIVHGSEAKADGYEPLNVLQTPPSVEGLRVITELRHAFVTLGGVVLKGDKVVSADLEGGCVKAVYTQNLGAEEPLVASDYVLASGSFFSNGLVSTYTHVYEPLFGADVEFPEDRTAWVSDDFYADQAFMLFGVKTDNKFHIVKDGAVIANLYAIGSILGGADVIKEQSREGIDILTALQVKEEIENARN